jgi:transcriptional regulator with XRE-family HTH domain
VKGEGKEQRATEIGRRIAMARREADGMTQRELADLLGVTERSVASYEAGDVVPYRFMRELEAAFGTPTAWILYGDDATPAETRAIIADVDSMKEKVDRILELVETLVRRDEHAEMATARPR